MQSFSFYHVFSSHMVLQRERPIVFSGKGEPGKKFTVTFADKTKKGTVDEDGEWSITFPFMNAGGPYSLSAGYDGAKPSVKFDDILIGEVWMCTGQSNMEMPVYSENAFWQTLNAKQELKKAKHPNIRLFNSFQTRRLAPEGPLEDENPDNPGWLPCDAKTVADFSACGYFFGRKLNEDLNIPIGLINTAWGGTRVEAWISDQALYFNGWELKKQDPKQKQSWKEIYNSNECKPLREWLVQFDKLGKVPAKWLAEKFDDSAWTETTAAFVSLDIVGRYVTRFHFKLPARFAGKELVVNLGIVNDVDKAYVNGKLVGSTGCDTEVYWSNMRSYTIPEGVTHAGDNVVAVVADNHYMTGGANYMDFSITFRKTTIKGITGLRFTRLFAVPNDFPIRPNPPQTGDDMSSPTSPNYPSTLFNALLNPWFRYAVRGVIWYQGCTNAGQFTYYPLHKLFIEELRDRWNDDAMPFLLVQLAAFHQHTPDHPVKPEDIDALPFPEFSAYGLTREIQAELAKDMENVGMITAFDCGDPSDIHPRDKQTVGLRLALKAEDMLHWISRSCDGPVFRRMSIEGQNVILYFDNVGKGLKTTDGKPPKAFVIGGENGSLFKANARIEYDTVIVSSPAVSLPQRVRYAFTGFCTVNLVNSDGFPAIPFRTDKPDYFMMF